MFTLYIIIAAVTGILMIGIVLIQNPKGGGLASNFSSANNLFGVQKTSESVEKYTWVFAAIILIVSIAASTANGSKTTTESKNKELIEAKAPKSTAPTMNLTPTPDQGMPAAPADQIPVPPTN